jgi:hypothetical protein
MAAAEARRGPPMEIRDNLAQTLPRHWTWNIIVVIVVVVIVVFVVFVVVFVVFVFV